MEEQTLRKRIKELYVKAEKAFENYLLYGGAIDLADGKFIPPREINPKNVSPREAFTHLMRGYRIAGNLEEACRMYRESSFQKVAEFVEVLPSAELTTRMIFEQGEDFINRAVGKLPEELLNR
jgi:pentatricopeptide repeat protein